MDSLNLPQLAIALTEATVVTGFLLLAFRLRAWFGLTHVFLLVGALQVVQTFASLGIAAELAPGVRISPGSIVLFPAALLVLLLIYVLEDADEARKLVYGLLFGNVAGGVMLRLLGLHLEFPGAINDYGLKREVFVTGPYIWIFGTVVLWIDSMLLITVFEFSGQKMSRKPFFRALVALACVLTFDALAITTIVFGSSGAFLDHLWRNFSGKMVAAVYYASAFAIGLRLIGRRAAIAPVFEAIPDLFEALTYRERFHRLREQSIKDPVTGVYNRAFFDEELERVLRRCGERGLTATLVLIDLDRFKELNDTQGHQAGDRALRAFAQSLQATIRQNDTICRWGGDEFAVILSGGGREAVSPLMDRARGALAETWPQAGVLGSVADFSFSVGVAAFPAEAQNASSLVSVADRRLYTGKKGGRGRVIFEDAS